MKSFLGEYPHRLAPPPPHPPSLLYLLGSATFLSPKRRCFRTNAWTAARTPQGPPYRANTNSMKPNIVCFHVMSSKSNFYTIHSRKLLLSYFLEFHKSSLHPKVWADMEILSGVTDI